MSENQSAVASFDAYVPFTPFQDSYAFEAEPAQQLALEPQSAAVVTPFVSEYAGADAAVSAEAQELESLLFDLYDEQLDEFLGQLTDEAWNVASEHATMQGETIGSASAEQTLEEWIAPLRSHADALVENVAEALTAGDPETMTDSELDALFERLEPRASGLEPVFEDFLGGLGKKLKKFAKKAVSVAKKGLAMIPGIGALVRRLKALVKPLLDRVLKVAVDKLPADLRPAARQLAQRVLGTAGAGTATGTATSTGASAGAAPAGDASAGGADEPATAPDVASIQQQFDLEMAALLFADESDRESMLTEALFEREHDEGAPIAELHEARARFVDELERGVDPQHALESFIPAVMALRPLARTVISVIGRDRVVSFLAGHLAAFIRPYATPQTAPRLARAIVDTGLRALSLEAPSDAEVQQLAPQAIASAVEDTVRRLAEFEGSLGQPALLEAAVTQAFHASAAESFPPQLLLPELHEATAGGTWVSMPLRGPRKYYRKYTRVFDVQITPQMAASLRTFGGVTLAAFLRDRLRVSAPVEARVHLYQATHGTSLGRIARLERGVPGLGQVAAHASAQFHPLTTAAAGMLLREPKLGRSAHRRYRSRRRRIATAQRFYYLEIKGTRPVTAAGAAGGSAAAAAAGRSSETRIALDFPKDEFRVCAYFSEADAQDVATKLRARDATAALVAVKRIYEAGVTTAFGGETQGRVTVLAEALLHEDAVGNALAQLPEAIRNRLAAKVVAWVGKGVAECLQARSPEFVTATEDAADGVTLVVTIASPPGAPVVRKLLAGGAGASPAEAAATIDTTFDGEPKVTVEIVAGLRVD